MSKRIQVAIAIQHEEAQASPTSKELAENQPASDAENLCCEGEPSTPSIIWPDFSFLATTRTGNA